MNSIARQDIGDGDAGFVLSAVFATLTAKQHEVFLLLAEGRTSKEIAWRLGITESAVVQRIEAVRSRTGSPLRAELARNYRLYVAAQGRLSTSAVASAVRPIHAVRPAEEEVRQDLTADVFAATKVLPDRQAIEDAWSRQTAGLIVPGIFAGPNAGLNRMAAMVVIALGLLTVAMVGLGVAQALANLL